MISETTLTFLQLLEDAGKIPKGDTRRVKVAFGENERLRRVNEQLRDVFVSLNRLDETFHAVSVQQKLVVEAVERFNREDLKIEAVPEDWRIDI